MNAQPYLDVPSTVLHRFVVAGISITSLRKQWKPALPKKKQESSYLVVINGKAKSVTYEIAGSGDIDAKGLVAETARISIAGSGNVGANAWGSADVEMIGSGNVDLTGGAKCSVDKHGSGDVNCS